MSRVGRLEEYLSLIENGCTHGFKPASDCPNEGCTARLREIELGQVRPTPLDAADLARLRARDRGKTRGKYDGFFLEGEK